MQIPCHCQHVPWHLGANAKSFLAQLIEDPNHHILNEPVLGGYQLVLSKVQGTQALIRYMELSTIQLVEYKALNLVDVGSSPMVEFVLYDVIINKLYTKSQLSIILLSRPFGATNCSCQKFKFTWLYLRSPCSLLHNDPALGGYTGWSFHEHKAITSPRLLQAWQPDTWGLQVICI